MPDPDSGLSREGIIGLCVGIASIILALLTYLLMLKIRKEKKEKKRLEEQAAARPDLLTQPMQGQMQTHEQGARDGGYSPYNINPRQRQEEYNLLDL
ncbi:hypothetical protein LTR84_004145 [Exophiala bonariae]|uniref:Uncharacterized protein n=1 Tax=Exophiala bonariae TaxID=1690606 RepID=A0AAV9N6A3_9EURO|nr:hypothetical protein LTR84_004145 [Exophiala bonariae]